MSENLLNSSYLGHRTYFSIAKNHLEIALESKDYMDNIPDLDDVDISEELKYFQQMEESSVISIIFSALTVESFINYYGILKLTRNYFEKHLDKLSVESKWVIIPRMANNEEISPGSHSMELLKDLIKTRNQLAHFKYKQKKSIKLQMFIQKVNSLGSGSVDAMEILEALTSDFLADCENAKKAVNTVYQIIGDLKKIDSDIPTEWLKPLKKS
jgi:hypothetical protein